MGLFDSMEDPLGEVSDALSDLGATDEADALDDATRMIQAAIDQNNGIPTPRARFLIGQPDARYVPTDQADWEDAIVQAGHIADNFLQRAGIAQAGLGELGGAILNKELSLEKLHEQPGHWVEDFFVEEGISRCWRAFVLVNQPLLNPNFPAFGTQIPLRDYGQLARNAFTDQAGDGWDWADVADAFALGNAVQQAWNNPTGQTAAASDAQDPDALDPRKLPIDHAVDSVTGSLDPNVPGRTTTAKYLGQFARLCVARRFPSSKFTLNERWFTGVVTGFEDLGVDATGVRRVRLTLRPRLFQLSLRRRYRMFKDLNAPEIVIAILKEHGIYPDQPADADLSALRLAPGGKELFGPLAVPDALGAAVGKVAGAVPFGLGESAGASIASALQQSLADWRPKRECCVQYGETDLEFVERLLAEEGLSYFFENKERRETLVICEDPRLAGKKVLTAGRLPLALFQGQAPFASPPQAMPNRASESAWNMAVARQPVPSGVTLRDRSYARPYDPTDLKAGESLELLSPGGLSSLTTAGGLKQMASQAFGLATELVGTPGTEDYAGPEAQQFEWPARLSYEATLGEALAYEAYGGPPMAQLRLESHRSLGAAARGASECATLAPGANVRISGLAFDVLHPAVQKPQRFLVTSVIHRGQSQNGAPLVYSNSFEALNIGIAYRPAPPARRPRIAGVQTAIVIDAKLGEDPASSDAEVHVKPSEHAWRVRVRFAWERGDTVGGENGSRWLRFASPFSGAGFGVLLAPRVGMEVVIGFEEGDPDRPYVLGALYSAVHGAGAGTRHVSSPKPAKPDEERKPGRVDDPARRTESSLTTRSWKQSELGDDTRGNEVRFDDFGGNERIRIYAQHDLAEEVGEDHVTSVLRDQENFVVGDQREIVGHDQTLLVRYPSENPDDKDCQDWGRHADVAKNEDVRVGGGSKKPNAPPKKPDYLMLDAIEGSDTTKVGLGGRRLHAYGNEIVSIAGEGASSERPGRSLSVAKDSTVTIETNDTFTVSGDRRVVAKGAHSIEAASIAIQTQGPADAGGRRETTGGLTMDEKGVSLVSSGTASLETKSFTVESSADRVLVKAKTKIYLHDDAGNAILLDAETRCIFINGQPDTSIRFATDGAKLELEDGVIRVAAGESEWTTTLAGDGTETLLSGPSVKLAASDEIYLNAPDILLGESS